MSSSNSSALCPICAGASRSAAHWQKPRFRRCEDCGAIFRDPFPTDAELRRLYRSSWADQDAHVDETGGTSLEFGRRILALLLRELGRPAFTGQKVLDFGAGRGGMSLALRELSAQVVAVEPFGYEQLRRLGIPVYRDIDEIPVSGQFDGIVMIEVIEHLRDPLDLLRRLHLLLKPGGWIFLTSPNPRGLAAILRGQRWGSASNAGHIVFFTPRTLHRALAQLGFKNVKQTHRVVRFPDASPARAIVQSALQLLHLGGGLRFLAVKS